MFLIQKRGCNQNSSKPSLFLFFEGKLQGSLVYLQFRALRGGASGRFFGDVQPVFRKVVGEIIGRTSGKTTRYSPAPRAIIDRLRVGKLAKT